MKQSASPDLLATIEDELAALSDAGLRRRMPEIEGAQAAEIVVDGKPAINFSSNNYLGLADSPLLTTAARAAMDQHGFGAGASRLIVGNLAPHRRLEARIAGWKQTEAALLFNSGYQANVGLVSALAGPEDQVFSDELNHASLIDGCRLARTRVSIYPHRDLASLEKQLEAAGPARRRLILTDSVFSMDGDLAPLRDLVSLAHRHGALLAVDEAHAVGVLGPDGAGLAVGMGVDIQVGTLGKALGGFGAYVAARRPVIDLLLHRARSFVFTTALPVPVAAAADAALGWLTSAEGARRRARLATVAHQAHAGLRELGFALPEQPCHIVPLRIRGGEPARALEAAAALLDRGIFAHAIRPPTVPPGSARLRFTLMATHSDAHLAAALSALADLRPLFETCR